jgi:MoaA/NifB/PqqE/SkfB family radical SAM enzyme
MGPEVAFIRLTNKCNARCQMCSVWRRAKYSFDQKALFTLLTDLKKNNLKKILFTGGEPTLYPDFPSLNKFLWQNKLDFGLISNGSTIYKDWAKLFPYKKPELIIFSLDSVVSKYHQENRGIPALTKKVSKSITKVLANNVQVAINTVLTKNNYQDLASFLTLKSLPKIKEWHWIPAKYCPSLSLNLADWTKCYNIYQTIKKNKKLKNVKLITPFNFCPFLKGKAKIYKNYSTQNFYQSHDCRILNKMIFIEINGDVYRCNCFPAKTKKFFLGNINKCNLNHLIKKIKKQIVLKRPGCKYCDPRNQYYNQTKKLLNYL